MANAPSDEATEWSNQRRTSSSSPLLHGSSIFTNKEVWSNMPRTGRASRSQRAGVNAGLLLEPHLASSPRCASGRNTAAGVLHLRPALTRPLHAELVIVIDPISQLLREWAWQLQPSRNCFPSCSFRERMPFLSLSLSYVGERRRQRTNHGRRRRRGTSFASIEAYMYPSTLVPPVDDRYLVRCGTNCEGWRTLRSLELRSSAKVSSAMTTIPCFVMTGSK